MQASSSTPPTGRASPLSVPRPPVYLGSRAVGYLPWSGRSRGGARARTARDPAPLRYVGVPPASPLGRGDPVAIAIQSCSVRIPAQRGGDRGRHDLCGCAAIPTFQPREFAHLPTVAE